MGFSLLEKSINYALGIFFFGIVTVLIFPVNSFAQDEFEKWKQQQEAEFKAYRDKFDKEFIEMLEKTWEEVGINKGSDFYKKEKPITIPTAPPRPVVDFKPPADAPTISEIIDVDIPEVVNTPPEKIELPVEKTMFEGLKTSRTSINYFSTNIPFEYPNKLREFFKPNEFISSKTDNNKIAEFWDKASSINHNALIDYTKEVRDKLSINDWGYVLLLNDISNTIFNGYDHKLISLYNWFLLTKAGYKVRVGYDQNGIYTLFATANDIFNTMYYTLDNEKYYLINLSAETQNPSSIFTYSGNHKAQSKLFDLRFDQLPVLGDEKEVISKKLTFTYDGVDYEIPVNLDKNLITYFEYFPLTELPVFFTASLTDNTKNALYKVLAPAVADMSEWEAVNFLLRFVQTSFSYKTDQDNFNREKYMMPEETLYYEYSDCDDRAILFANLVQDLLDMNVVGLRYSKHLATAVEFSGPVEGDAHYHLGKKYIVADPTYINADVGMTMRQYQNEKPEIVSF